MDTYISAYLKHCIGDDVLVSRANSSVNNTYTKFAHQAALVIPALATDVQLSFYDVSIANVIYIETNKPIWVTLNSSGNSPTYVSSFYFVITQATSLFIANNNITDATVKVILLGT